MAKINFIVGPFHPVKFSGGILCILEYAKGLLAKGHQVNIIPILPSQRPKWTPIAPTHFITSNYLRRIKASSESLIQVGKSIVTKNKNGIKTSVSDFFTSLCLIEPRLFSYESKRALSLQYSNREFRDSDITIATSYETALPVSLYGKGKLFYFMQHYEPYFKDESPNPYLAEKEAYLSYFLGLQMIANSSWLQSKIQSLLPNHKIYLCPNAINHTIFNGNPKHSASNETVKIISYGGRNAKWKGFIEMAQAIKIAKLHLPKKEIIWKVYGDALLPPSNPIAEYIPLGFLNLKQLAQAYKEADILLSASWYESFPLFPLEAMACGLPVITSQYGTEEYAFHENTAEVVEPKSPDQIATGLIRLIENFDYRNRIASSGNSTCKRFTWTKSIDCFEQVILGHD